MGRASLAVAKILQFWTTILGLSCAMVLIGWSILDYRYLLLLRSFREEASQSDLAFFAEAGGVQLGLSIQQKPEKLALLRPIFSELFSGATEIAQLESEFAAEELLIDSSEQIESEGALEQELFELKRVWGVNLKQFLQSILSSGYLEIKAAFAKRRLWMTEDLSDRSLVLLLKDIFDVNGVPPFKFTWIDQKELVLTMDGSDVLRIVNSFCLKEAAMELCQDKLEVVQDWLESYLIGGVKEFATWTFEVHLYFETETDKILVSTKSSGVMNSFVGVDLPDSSSLRSLRIERMISDCESFFGSVPYGMAQLRHAALQNHLLQVVSLLNDENENDELSEYWQGPKGNEKLHQWEESLSEITSWSTSSLWGWSLNKGNYEVKAEFENPDLSPGDQLVKTKPREHFVSLVQELFPLQFLPEKGYLVKWKDTSVIRIEGFFEEVKNETDKY